MCISLSGCSNSGKTAETQPATQQAATQAAKKSAATQAAADNQTGDSDSSSAVSGDAGSGDSEETYAGLTASEACSKALERSDDGVSVDSYYKGKGISGEDAWLVMVQEADGTVNGFYVGFGFCIPYEG